MDELESQSVPDATVAVTEAAAGDDDANGPSSAAAVAAAVTTATTMILASSSADVSTTRKPSGEFDVVVETPCDSGSLPDSTCSAAPLSWKPPAAAAAEASVGTRSTETREVHHVTFAEPCNKYVHSDSGIVLSPDDSDVNDVNVDGQSTEVTDDECDEVTGGQAATTEDGPVRCPAPTNAVPGPPIIKLHRCRSNESQDNPFLFDGELRRKADYIIAHSTILRTYVRIADPDQIPIDQQQQQSTSDPELHPVTAGDDATEPQASELAAGLTNGEGGQVVVSPESPSATPQKVASKELSSAPVRNGEAEEPLLCRKKEENNLESSPKKHTRSKKQICCVVQ